MGQVVLRDVTSWTVGSAAPCTVYAQRFRLLPAQSSPTVVLIHGGGLTGAIFESDLTGHPGWLWELLKAGYETVVVDWGGVGRAGIRPAASELPIRRTDDELWRIFRIGPPAHATERTAFPGSRFPIANLDRLLAQIVPRFSNTESSVAPLLAEALSRVAPAALISHSAGSDLAIRAVAEGLLIPAAHVMIEPTVPLDLDLDGGRFSRLASTPQLIIWGDNIALSGPSWTEIADRSQRFVNDVRRHDGQIDLIYLASHGVEGNSHMLMADDNQQAILALVTAWLRRRLN